MAKILVVTFGSLGDLHPCMGLSRELLRRGHEVTLATTAYHQSYVENAGFRFTPIRPDIRGDNPEIIRDILDARRGSEYLHTKHIFPYIRENFQDLLAASQSHDVIVSSVLSYNTPIVSKVTGIPWVVGLLSPMLMWSGYEPPILPPIPFLGKLPLPAFAHRFILNGLMKTAERWAEPLVELRKEYGLETKSPYFDSYYSPYLTLCFWSDQFGAKQRDWREPSETTGFIYYDPNENVPLSPEIQKFLQAGDPPVVFTMGSTVVEDPSFFIKLFEETAERLSRRAIITVGRKVFEQYRNRSTNKLLFVDYAPYGKLFAAASLIVHQGGVGTTAQALLAGKPSIIFPFATDQFDNAYRIELRGLGISIPKARINPKRISEGIEDLLGNSETVRHCQMVGKLIASENGGATAAKLIETRVLAKSKST